eukprot:CAMPEP_0206430868 /NCGR_PEP_ID=MMETSP0324_2-20121206/7053_1 /ASSEMBLY_ACC=CAM_ASM_000836 /TAXON_ID=2866 /ORGANISM="Crypthecodinium cohnii, Strain Seligo" /LENGTH=506 /DNA_ID=CAMNT_0053896743 /DNA_START=81 /DNA_END=1601 /DNA_ORIENTATION=-
MNTASSPHNQGRKRRGPDFHSSRSQRNWLGNPTDEPVQQPGPGAYNLRTTLNRGSRQPFRSGEPRLSTAQPLVTASCSTSLEPGPADYVVGSALGPRPAESTLPTGAFRSTSTGRSTWVRSPQSPFLDGDSLQEPAQYFAPEADHSWHASALKLSSSLPELGKHRRGRSTHHAFLRTWHGVHAPHQVASLKERDGSEIAAFSSTSTRPCLAPTFSESNAGPATYDRSYSSGQSLSADLRYSMKIGKGGAFAAPKVSDRFARGAFALPPGAAPGPSDYGRAMRQYDIVGGGRHDTSGGAFRSGVPQVGPDLSVDQEPRPGPGSYELTKPWIDAQHCNSRALLDAILVSTKLERPSPSRKKLMAPRVSKPARSLSAITVNDSDAAPPLQILTPSQQGRSPKHAAMEGIQEEEQASPELREEQQQQQQQQSQQEQEHEHQPLVDSTAQQQPELFRSQQARPQQPPGQKPKAKGVGLNSEMAAALLLEHAARCCSTYSSRTTSLALSVAC